MIELAFIAYIAHLCGMLLAKTGFFLQKLTHMEKEKNQVEEIENDDDFLRVLPDT